MSALMPNLCTLPHTTTWINTHLHSCVGSPLSTSPASTATTARMHAGMDVVITVTAFDAYGHVVAAGNPDFQLDCANCSQLLRTAPSVLAPGTTRFAFSYTATGPSTHRLILNSTSQVFREDTVSVTAANATVTDSRLSGPSRWRAGESVVFEFEPHDEFGNIAPFAANSSDQMDLRAVMREVTPAGAEQGSEVGVQASLRSDGLAYEISVPASVLNKTGEYYAVVQLHARPEDAWLRRDAEVRVMASVIYERLDIAQSQLQVRPPAGTPLHRRGLGSLQVFGASLHGPTHPELATLLLVTCFCTSAFPRGTLSGLSGASRRHRSRFRLSTSTCASSPGQALTRGSHTSARDTTSSLDVLIASQRNAICKPALHAAPAFGLQNVFSRAAVGVTSRLLIRGVDRFGNFFSRNSVARELGTPTVAPAGPTLLLSDFKTGYAALDFTADGLGTFEISVQQFGVHAAGSPFTVVVEERLVPDLTQTRTWGSAVDGAYRTPSRTPIPQPSPSAGHAHETAPSVPFCIASPRCRGVTRRKRQRPGIAKNWRPAVVPCMHVLENGLTSSGFGASTPTHGLAVQVRTLLWGSLRFLSFFCNPLCPCQQAVEAVCKWATAALYVHTGEGQACGVCTGQPRAGVEHDLYVQLADSSGSLIGAASDGFAPESVQVRPALRAPLCACAKGGSA